MIFAQHNVHESDAAAQIQAFDDTWHWTPETNTLYTQAISGGVPARVADALTAMRTLLGENDAMAYLVGMAPRLVELHRVLKPTGSLSGVPQLVGTLSGRGHRLPCKSGV